MALEQFTDAECSILSNYCTNVESDVFALTNLPDVVKGTLFSRYSRSPKSLKRLLLDEFVNSDEIDIRGPGGDAAGGSSNDKIIAIRRAEKFYERVLIQYGDDSVAELGGAHIALENISNLATKFIEDRRIGLSPLEKSSRYVYFNEKVNGEYRFYRDKFIISSKYADDYINACNLLFDAYSSLMDPMRKYYEEKFPKDGSATDRAYNSTIKAKVCDSLRGLLPASALTNVGLFGNARAYEYLITKMRASNLGEISALGKSAYEELNKIFPVFLKRAYAKYGDMSVDYFKSMKPPAVEGADAENTSIVRLADCDEDAVDKVVAAIVYANSGLRMQTCIEKARGMGEAEKREIIRNYIGDRQNRRHRPGRAFENAYYLFDVCTNFGAYRDLHRHRILTQERQLLTVNNGYDLPRDLEDSGYADKFREAVETAAEVFNSLHSLSPEHAQYVVPFAYRVRWYINMNLREAYHLIELRSTGQGHPDYRKIAQQMYLEIKKVHPILAEGMKFVDMNDYGLERLEAEKRIDRKLAV